MNERPRDVAADVEQLERPALRVDSRLELLPLSIVRDGDEFVVGNPQAGIFIVVPEVGVVALRQLEDGATVAEAAEAASRHAGETVDVLEFAQGLVESGLVSGIDDQRLGRGSRAEPSWIEGVSPAVARPFFSRAAWTVYVALFAFSLAVFAARPELWPSFEDFFFYPNPAVSVVAVVATSVLITACHEASHWFAARAVGVGARFRVSRRLFLPVFETDASQLWSVPRRQRYVVFLAGMAFETALLAASLGLRLAWAEGLVELPPLLVRFLGTVVLLTVIGLAFQALVFLRTDLYAVLITALGCRNLYRVNALFLKEKLWRLKPAEERELVDAHPRDREVARWFASLYVVGIAWASWYFVEIFIPSTVLLAGWMFHGVAGAPIDGARFWEAFTIGVVAAAQALFPLAIFVRERVAARRGDFAR
jgi:putative peptide zinc metalloprotease protein